jgi:hypothetical protein
MKNIWIVLVSLTLFSYGMQTYAGNERKNSKKPEAVRADSAIAKTNPGIKVESKANSQNLDTAKRPPDPLEKGADKQHGMENMKKMPPDDFGKGMQTN